MRLPTGRLRGIGAGAATLLLLAGCSDGQGLDMLEEALLDDMTLVAADATVEDATQWSQPFGFGSAAGAPAAMPGRPGGEHGFGHELSGTRSVEFFDVDGNVQDGYDEVTTDVIQIIVDVEGEVTRDAWSASISRTRVMTISGLEGEEETRTFNGTGLETVSRSRHADDGTERSVEMEGSVTFADVVVPIPGSEPRYPVSGTITRTMTATITGPDGTRTRTFEMTITFDGDSTATLTVNGRTFDIDLTATDGGRPLHRRGDDSDG